MTTHTIIIIGVILLGATIYHFGAHLHVRRLKGEGMRMKKRLDRIIDSMPLLYTFEEMVYDDNGTIVDTIYRKVNHLFEEKTGKKDDCIGRRSSEMNPPTLKEVVLKACNTARRMNRDVNFQCHVGNGTFVDCVARPVDGGKYMEFFCIDSTNLHNTQKALSGLSSQMELALEVSHVTPLRLDLKTGMLTCIHISDAKDEHGLKNIIIPEDEMYEYFVKEDKELLQRNIEDLVSGRVESIKVDVRSLLHIRGELRKEWVEITAVVGERDTNGKPLTLEGSRQIITQRKTLEMELKEAKKNAEELNGLKSAFLANMSHEIRTPLNAIVGFSQLLTGTGDKDEQQEYSRIIETNSSLLLQLVGDILDLSKIEAGTMEFAYCDFDLNKLICETEETLRLKIDDSQHVALKYDLGMEHCLIHSEPNRLTQVLVNLVSNAIKCTERGSVTIGYRLTDDNMLQFHVSDTGCGIDKSHIGEVFDRFVKLNSFKKGTGLGLSICKNIVEKMGGKIWVDSELGKGSTFYFTLPYVAAGSNATGESAPMHHNPETATTAEPVTTKAAPAAPDTTTATQSQNGLRPTILVAEDNDSNYKLVNAILSRDYNIIHACNGKEAVEMTAAHSPSLVIMDISMPVMDGHEATRLIKRDHPAMPILALTAYATPADEEKILNSGFDSYMPKPVNTILLRNRIKEMLQQ